MLVGQGAMMLSHVESDNEADLLTRAFLVWIFEKLLGSFSTGAKC